MASKGFKRAQNGHKKLKNDIYDMKKLDNNSLLQVIAQ
jgi:hypothetical protein